MTEPSIVAIVVAIVAAAGGLAGAIVAGLFAARARRESRQERLEARLARSERDNRLLWLWCRQLVDHIYSRAAPPPPPAPAGLFEDSTQPRKDIPV